MTNQEQDLRVIKTKSALAETLFTLLDKKPFQRITVNDICQNALVSRSTFYLHFKDKYHLLLYCLQGEQECLVEASKEKNPQGVLRSFLTVVQERQRLYKNLLTAELDSELIHMLQTEFHRFFMEIILATRDSAKDLPAPVQILAAYYASGMAGVIIWWIQNDFSPAVEDLSGYLYNILSTA